MPAGSRYNYNVQAVAQAQRSLGGQAGTRVRSALGLSTVSKAVQYLRRRALWDVGPGTSKVLL